MEDFTEQMLDNQNQEVDELCGCTGKEKTRSRRVQKQFHESWCFYYMHVEDQMKRQLDQWKSTHGNQGRAT